MALRTNYKDDVFTGKRKYRMTTNPDTTVSFDDETEYVQQGDTYGAAQLNEANSKINDLDSHAYRDSDAAETTMADNDYIPFYDASAGAKRRMTLSNIKSFLLGALAPKSHPSNSASTYGAGNASQFGHVKLSDNYTSSAGTANQSVGASSQAVHNAYANRAPINHSSSDTTYGKGSSSAYGHLKVSDTYTSNPGAASDGVAASGKAVSDAYAAGQSNYNNLNNAKAPNNHKSAATTYGVGNATEFGHLKISDNITDIAGAASDGVAASSKAVVDAKNAAISTAASDATSKANAAQSAAASDATTKANDAYTSANNNSVSRYNDIVGELTANGNRLYMDYKDGKYGYNTAANRGADTFHPFNPYSETVLWSQDIGKLIDRAFDCQVITLPQSIQNFTYLKFECYSDVSSSEASHRVTYSAMCTIADIRKTIDLPYQPSGQKQLGCFGVVGAVSWWWADNNLTGVRQFYATDNTHIWIDNYRTVGDTSGSLVNTWMVPYRITGIKIGQ